MKKHSLAVVALLFLFANTIYAQKINCAWCKNGDGYNLRRDWIVCLNCKNWAKSYRDKVPCTVCKDNRGHYSAYYKVTCSDCKGSGRNFAAEKQAKWDSSEEGIKAKKEFWQKLRSEAAGFVQEETKKAFCESNYSSVPLPEQIKKDLLGKKIGTWTFDKPEEIVQFGILTPYIDRKNCILEIEIGLILESYTTHKRYDCKAVLTYLPNNTWTAWEYSGFIPNLSTITLRY